MPTFNRTKWLFHSLFIFLIYLHLKFGFHPFSSFPWNYSVHLLISISSFSPLVLSILDLLIVFKWPFHFFFKLPFFGIGRGTFTTFSHALWSFLLSLSTSTFSGWFLNVEVPEGLFLISLFSHAPFSLYYPIHAYDFNYCLWDNDSKISISSSEFTEFQTHRTG